MDEDYARDGDKGHPRVYEAPSVDNGGADDSQNAGRPRVLDEPVPPPLSPPGPRILDVPSGQRGTAAGAGEQPQRASGEEHALRSSTIGLTGVGVAAFGLTLGLALGWQRQVAGFFGMRLAKNLEYGRRLLEVRDTREYGRLSGAYAQEMMFDYVTRMRGGAGDSLRSSH